MVKSMVDNALIKKALKILQCPGCQHGKLDYRQNEEAPVIVCKSCSSEYPVVNGIIDFFPDYKHESGFAQKLMEKKSVVNIYEKYWRPVFTRFGSPVTYNEEESWLRSFVNGEKVNRVLDLATGTGRYARMLADIYNPEILFAFDLSMPMLEKAIEDSASGEYKNIIFMRGNAQCLPFINNSIDRINCFGALHLFPDPYGAIEELSRIGQPKTVFTCLTACKADGFISSRFQRFFSKAASFIFFNIDDLKNHLNKSGFHDFQYITSKMVAMFMVKLKKNKSPQTGRGA